MSKTALFLVFGLFLVIGGCSKSKKQASPKLKNPPPPVVDYLEENMKLYETQSNSQAAYEDHIKWCYGDHPEVESPKEIPAKVEVPSKDLKDRIARLRAQYVFNNN